MSDDTPAPPPTTHDDGRELGYGAVGARPAIADSEAAPGKIEGGESSGGAYQHAVKPRNSDSDSDSAGQNEQGYSGPDNPNATSTKDASHDRAS
ncbi:hypothetical protein [Glacieibacterium frigidum]|uniref:Uncharacterized protein n=1 Tax=Glacieibacterium frigidum TaxID=2593303 RepID=A0A552UFH4_9SPHN|nr:hypothetical protein [Glacieibacterium frigidum]TRW16970.1 hypothetical protein FMM06_01810 [Glacieibacterium frigidum]